MKFLKEIKGQATRSVGAVVALLIMIAVGAVVMYKVTGSLPTTTDSYAENAIENVNATGIDVFNLMTVLAIVFVAALIIGVVIRAMG